MRNLNRRIEEYLFSCEYQKNLGEQTIKAYRIDLRQFFCFSTRGEHIVKKDQISDYISYLHSNFKPKTVKRKIASVRAFFNYMEQKDKRVKNPFLKMKVCYKETFQLPRVISLGEIQNILSVAYKELRQAKTEYERGSMLRNVVVIELLFATGLRVSELCTLLYENIDLDSGTIHVLGKGRKERILQIENHDVLQILKKYYQFHVKDITRSGYFFLNRFGNMLSDQSVRTFIGQYAKKAEVNCHVTPHMIRHTFATLLLEEDVDIRYIQHMLGHSSITTTQIYTHVASAKQKQILLTKHPRNKIVC